VTPSTGVTPKGNKFLWVNLQRIVEKRGQTAKKVWGDTLQGVTPECEITTDSDEKKRSSVFQKKINRDDTGELSEMVMTEKGCQVFRKK